MDGCLEERQGAACLFPVSLIYTHEHTTQHSTVDQNFAELFEQQQHQTQQQGGEEATQQQLAITTPLKQLLAAEEVQQRRREMGCVSLPPSLCRRAPQSWSVVDSRGPPLTPPAIPGVFTHSLAMGPSPTRALSLSLAEDNRTTSQQASSKMMAQQARELVRKWRLKLQALPGLNRQVKEAVGRAQR